MILGQQKRKGFLLIDVLLGIFVLTTTLVIGIIVIRTGIERNLEVASRVAAIYLIQEKTEILRNIRDSNLVAGRPWNTGLLIVGERREEITLNRVNFTRITTIDLVQPPPNGLPGLPGLPGIPGFPNGLPGIPGLPNGLPGIPNAFFFPNGIIYPPPPPTPTYINITVIVQWLHRGRLLQIETRKRLYGPPPPPNGIIPPPIIPPPIIPPPIIPPPPNGIIPPPIIPPFPNGIIF